MKVTKKINIEKRKRGIGEEEGDQVREGDQTGGGDKGGEGGTDRRRWWECGNNRGLLTILDRSVNVVKYIIGADSCQCNIIRNPI